MTDDERAQAYEDNYWAEWDGRDVAIAAAVETWSADDMQMFENALEQINHVRDEERDGINDLLTGDI